MLVCVHCVFSRLMKKTQPQSTEVSDSSRRLLFHYPSECLLCATEGAALMFFPPPFHLFNLSVLFGESVLY